MKLSTSKKPVIVSAALAVTVSLLSGCSTTEPKLGLGSGKGIYAANGKTSGREYFSTASLGVGASPRVLAFGGSMPRGGGREQIGQPYTVAGKTYYPTANPKGAEVGLASWYGAAFHGRLTANGEVYDMGRLTAAHKTMPLPSYARVTNLENGRSLIVRVNDRGPFADDRVIDLSKRAADLLDYTHGGTAKVKVEYAGRAPLNGNDDAFLMASVQGAPGFPGADRFGGPASGVMLASNSVGTPAWPVKEVASAQVALPAIGPLPVMRPALEQRVAISAYASRRISDAFDTARFAASASDWKHAR